MTRIVPVTAGLGETSDVIDQGALPKSTPAELHVAVQKLPESVMPIELDTDTPLTLYVIVSTTDDGVTDTPAELRKFPAMN